MATIKFAKMFSLLFVLFLLSITLFGAFFVDNADAAMRPRLFRRMVSGGACSSCNGNSCSTPSNSATQNKNSCQNCPDGVCTKAPSSGVEVDIIVVPDDVSEKCCNCKCGCPNCKCAAENCKDNNGKCNCTCGCKSCKCCNEDVKKSTNNASSSNNSSSVYRSRTVVRNNSGNSLGKGRIRAFIKKILHRN